MIYEFNGYKPVIDPSSFVHKEATIIGNVIIGKDVYVGPGASIRGDWGQITIKDGCNVQDNCIIHIFPGYLSQRTSSLLCNIIRYANGGNPV